MSSIETRHSLSTVEDDLFVLYAALRNKHPNPLHNLPLSSTYARKHANERWHNLLYDPQLSKQLVESIKEIPAKRREFIWSLFAHEQQSDNETSDEDEQDEQSEDECEQVLGNIPKSIQAYESRMQKRILSHSQNWLASLKPLQQQTSQRLLMTRNLVHIGSSFSKPVDLNLARFDPLHLIPPNQCIIDFNRKAEFTLYNTGRFPVFVDGFAVLANTSHTLTHGVIIQIRQLQFAFEINERLQIAFTRSI